MRSVEGGTGVGDIASNERRCRSWPEVSDSLGTGKDGLVGGNPSARVGETSSTGVITVMAISSSSSSVPLQFHRISYCT